MTCQLCAPCLGRTGSGAWCGGAQLSSKHSCPREDSCASGSPVRAFIQDMLLLLDGGMACSMLCNAIACALHIAITSPPSSSPPAQVVSNAAELETYDPADICLALCRMVAYNIGQLAYMNAMKYGLKRVFFGGFFIRNHPYTMETISFAIRWGPVGLTGPAAVQVRCVPAQVRRCAVASGGRGRCAGKHAQ